jgi:hypothetical protein
MATVLDLIWGRGNNYFSENPKEKTRHQTARRANHSIVPFDLPSGHVARSRFGDQDFTKRRGSSHALNEKASGVIAGPDPAMHLLVKVDGYAGHLARRRASRFCPRMTTLRV